MHKPIMNLNQVLDREDNLILHLFEAVNYTWHNQKHEHLLLENSMLAC